MKTCWSQRMVAGSSSREPPSGGMHVDLGLVVSNDGIYFREPVPGFQVISHGAEDEWDSVSLAQGHAFTNEGDHTLIWYSHWDSQGKFRTMEIGLATLRRDGFGYLSRHHKHSPGHFVTRLIFSEASGKQLLINVAGVSVSAPLTVELLDRHDRPIPVPTRQRSPATARSAKSSGPPRNPPS